MSNEVRRALLVIDVQNEYVTGNLPIGFPDVQQSLKHIGEAMDLASQAGIPVIVIRQNAPTDSPLFATGSHGWQLHETVAIRSCELLLDKKLPSAFPETGLADWLAERQINTLTVVGFMTQNCVDSTIREAVHRGFAVEFLHDAAGAVTYSNRAGSADAEQIHKTFCVVMQSRFAAVMSTEEWAAVLAGKSEPERDNIWSSSRRG